MPIQSRPEITIIQLIVPLVVALIYITLCSLFKEPIGYGKLAETTAEKLFR